MFQGVKMGDMNIQISNIELSDEIVERAINAFKERLKKKREKEKINEIGENFSRSKEIKKEMGKVIDFSKYRKV